MKKCLVFLAVLSINIVGRAQSNFVEAVVVSNSGDSIYGKIDYRNWKNNPQTIDFINAANEKQTFDASSIRGFHVQTVNETYTSFSVAIDMVPGDMDRALNSGFIDSVTLHKRVFLLQLINHPELSLYQFTDNNKDHFYYKKGSEQPVELIHQYLYDESSKHVRENEAYKQQLTLLLQGCQDAIGKLKTLQFRKKEIQNIILKYLQCNAPGLPVDIKKDDPGTLQFGIVGGLSLTKFKFKGSFPTLGGHSYDDDASPVFGALLDIGLPRNRNKVHIINEVIYKSYKTGTSYVRPGPGTTSYIDTGKVNLNFSYLQLNTIFRYILPSNASVKPFFNLGVGNAFMIAENENKVHIKSSFGGNERDGKAIDGPDKYEFSFLGGLGLKIRSLHMEFRYVNSVKSFSPYINLSVNPTSFQFITSYQF